MGRLHRLEIHLKNDASVSSTGQAPQVRYDERGEFRIARDLLIRIKSVRLVQTLNIGYATRRDQPVSSPEQPTERDHCPQGTSSSAHQREFPFSHCFSSISESLLEIFRLEIRVASESRPLSCHLLSFPQPWPLEYVIHECRALLPSGRD